jgi:hypothetical protein
MFELIICKKGKYIYRISEGNRKNKGEKELDFP